MTHKALKNRTIVKSKVRYASHKSINQNPLEYYKSRMFLVLSTVGYNEKKPGYAAIAKQKYTTSLSDFSVDDAQGTSKDEN